MHAYQLYSNRSRNQIAGYTLIELLLSLTLSVLLIQGFYIIFLNAEKNYHFQLNLMDAQNTIRTFSKIILNDIASSKTKVSSYQNASILEGSDGITLIHERQFHHYFIGKTSRVENKKPIYALYFKEDDHAKTELLPYVNSMTILYSIIENGFLKNYPASDIMDWAEVTGISIHYTIQGIKTYEGYIYAALSK